jgi:hypothetical protein
MEQTARALNAVCRAWLTRESQRPLVKQASFVIRYHQERNKAARESRLRHVKKRE